MARYLPVKVSAKDLHEEVLNPGAHTGLGSRKHSNCLMIEQERDTAKPRAPRCRHKL